MSTFSPSNTSTPAAPTAPLTEVLPVAPAAESLERVLPRVNLLPPEVSQRRRVRTTQKALVAGAVLALGVVGSAWAVEHHSVGSAQSDLDASIARGAQLQHQQAQYADAPKVVAELDAARTARRTALASDVAWYQYLDDLSRAAPDAVWLTSVSGNLTGAAAGATAATGTTAASGTTPATGDTTATAAATAGGNPLATSGIGALTLAGSALSYDDVAGYLDRLVTVSGVADPYLTTSTADDSSGRQVVTFSITAVVTADALSHHFDDEGAN
jgi:Tfp pilus assembly protein PilN